VKSFKAARSMPIRDSMNAVAKRFWNEILDLHAPLDGELSRARASRTRKRSVRKTAPVRRTSRRLA